MIKSSRLAWFVVSDIKKAKEFYVEKLGLVLKDEALEYGWLEVEPEDGSYKIGIAEYNQEYKDDLPGSGAVITFTVDDLDKSIEEYAKKGIKFIGEIQEVPGHVKMVSFLDSDMNKFQLCQYLNSEDFQDCEDCEDCNKNDECC